MTYPFWLVNNHAVQRMIGLRMERRRKVEINRRFLSIKQKEEGRKG
jgi:hypothetical protein